MLRLYDTTDTFRFFLPPFPSLSPVPRPLPSASTSIAESAISFRGIFHRENSATYRTEIDESVSPRYAIGHMPLRGLPHPHQERVGEDLGGRRAGEEKSDHRES